ncbi:MAG: acetyl/propionyl/methylcrotonyl-CoA carboxylase subunit alpha [Proteobacteria bacterium]|nr:acetyl/propionyl/methylcrotonyl-CoA carboxylase subunit alpha [Pseudomonadota bacterium]
MTTPLPSVLIANRGEIACRIIRTARRLGMRTIAVYSDADARAPFVAMADEAHRLGPAPARESYLRGDLILDIAKRAGAACIHPGYGFLSENTDFARAAEAAGIIFVGPPPSAIEAMGLKDAAKRIAVEAGVPVVPGYHGENQDPAFLKQKAYEIGYPVLIKAVAGGGGKGMRKVERHADFDDALASCKREALNAFSDDRVLIEKYVTAPRHVEIQVFADRHGNVVHLFERDCSLQRRHQKVIEEAPAPGMPPAMREAMGKAAVEAARAVGYVGAGTVEFIADGTGGLKENAFYFMEMNTRLQVEHPVTEAITGLDLVELQFRVAAGEKLPFAQKDLAINGHAVEARLYAEDPESGFLPSTGKLWALHLPDDGSVRVDTGVARDGEVTGFYDPMIAKIIAHGATRDEALDRLAAALGQTIVAGPRTNTAFLIALCNAPGFRIGDFDTGFIERNLDALGAVEQPVDLDAVAAAVPTMIEQACWRVDHEASFGEIGHEDESALQPVDPWSRNDGFTFTMPNTPTIDVVASGKRLRVSASQNDWLRYQVGIAPGDYTRTVALAERTDHGERGVADEPSVAVVETNAAWLVIRRGRQTEVALFDPLDVDLESLDVPEGGALVKAPMHGKLIALYVKPGDRVEKGTRLAVVEAMKMEHALTAPRDGVVADVSGHVGQQVSQGAKLILIGEG